MIREQLVALLINFLIALGLGIFTCEKIGIRRLIGFLVVTGILLVAVGFGDLITVVFVGLFPANVFQGIRITFSIIVGFGTSVIIIKARNAKN